MLTNSQFDLFFMAEMNAFYDFVRKKPFTQLDPFLTILLLKIIAIE